VAVVAEIDEATWEQRQRRIAFAVIVIALIVLIVAVTFVWVFGGRTSPHGAQIDCILGYHQVGSGCVPVSP
jgi:heme/copper-type cytochrome/quinol oxidase subunit 2